MIEIKRLIKYPRTVVLSLNHHGMLRFLSDKCHTKWMYYASFNKKLNIESPITFNEKIQWLKLYDRNPLYTTLVDKYEVKRYVSSIIGEDYIIPTYGVWDTFDAIDFNILPDQFVLKTTHDGGGSGVVICKDKTNFDIEKARKVLNDSLSRDVYSDLREWPYKNVRHRILAEQYMENEGEDLEDYKVHCFNGIPKMVLVCRGRYSKDGMTEDFYMDDWSHIPVKRPKCPNAPQDIPRPSQLTEMLELSKKLSNDIPFVRVDFYVVGERLYFGEMTFYPTSGYTAFEPDSYDEIIGSWLKIDTK